MSRVESRPGLGARLRSAVSSHAAEVLVSAAILGGWAALTAAVAILTAPVAWLFSLAVLLFSLAGWKLLWTLASEGLYTLSREDDG